MPKITIFSEKCKGCMLCTRACPKKILKASTDKLNSKGYYPVTIIAQEKCIGCGLCATMCPDSVIKVER